MFYGASSFNQVLCWDLTGVSTEDMFDGSGGSHSPTCAPTLVPTLDLTPVPTTTPAPTTTPVPTHAPTATFAPTPTKAPDDNEKKDDDGDGDEEDGPDEGALGIIGDAVIDYWSITKNLFTDIWNHITRN